MFGMEQAHDLADAVGGRRASQFCGHGKLVTRNGPGRTLVGVVDALPRVMDETR